MKTRQHTYESENSEYEEGLENSENLDSKEQIREEIQATVDERGFYLYECSCRLSQYRYQKFDSARDCDFCDGSFGVCTRKYCRNHSRNFWDFVSFLSVCRIFFDFQNASKMKPVSSRCERDFYRQSSHHAFQNF